MLKPLPLRNIRIDDDFFAPRIENARNAMIPYMWDALHDRVPGVAPSGCIKNFRIAAGLEQGEFTGFVFQDSDLWKWIEGASYALESQWDEALDREMDEAIALAAQAQQADGYLDTYYIINGLDKRFTNLKDHHELYVAGHMFEAAAAHYAATGKRTLLDVACRFADCLVRHFGPDENQLHGYPGHEEAELGLARLYAATGREAYLQLAGYFLDERGKQPLYFREEDIRRGQKVADESRNQWANYSYYQADIPVREQKAARGHAVRQCYLLAGMAEVGGLTGDQTLTDAADRVYRNIVDKQMYITGGVGSTHEGEAFSFDYDLPPERCYNETCASIALIMTAQRLNRISPDSGYGDTVERALYNGILSGVSLDGKKYFYMNPLEVWPERCERRQDMRIDDERQGWFGCACCPPNLLRTLTGLGNYLYSMDDGTLYVDQYVSSHASVPFETGAVGVRVKSCFPWEGKAEITVETQAVFALALRVPSWAEKWTVRLNGREISPCPENGYAFIRGEFHPGDTVTLECPMTVRFVSASTHTPNYAGKAAVTRGPIVYCLEEADNGGELWNLYLEKRVLETRFEKELLQGVETVSCPGIRESAGEALYSAGEPERTPQKLQFIPYYAWGNRGKGEMTVWVHKA